MEVISNATVRTVVLNQDNFVLQRACGKVQRHFLLSKLEKVLLASNG